MIRHLAAAMSLAALMAMPMTASAVGGDGAGGPIDEEISCTEPAPAALAVGGTATVSVLVLIDGLSAARRDAVVGHAHRVLTASGVNLSVTYESFNPGTSDVSEILGLLAAGYAGRPHKIVHLVTARDLVSSTLGTSVAGQASCIGGIRFDDRRFSVSEALGTRDDSFAGRIAAHEMAHLMGAHHHYAECASGAVGASPTTPCTLMFNTANLASDAVSVINAAVIRGHAGTWG